MTESLRLRVLAAHNDLKSIIDKDPSTKVGAPTVAVLRHLLTDAKDSGADAGLCDSLISSLAIGVSAADAFLVSGQLVKIVGASAFD